MFPWKLLFRFFSAMVLMATGGYAAGHDLPMPFDFSPTQVSAPPAAPVTDPSTTTTTDSSTTTTADTPPVVVVPAPQPDPVPPTTAPKPPTTTTTVPPKGKPAAAPAAVAPAAPVQGDAPSVCAAAATPTCAPVDPNADNSHAARVQRCQDWWNSLADAFAKNNRPEWAAKAKELAGQCDAFVTRWEQWQQDQQRWEDQKGDHNRDGHPDDGKGWHQDAQNHDDQGDDHPAPPTAQPQPQTQPQARELSRHGEGRH